MSFFAKPSARVAINMPPRSGSWGGANQWAAQCTRYLRFYGFEVRFDLRQPVDAVILTHMGLTGKTAFGAAETARYRRDHPGTPVIHRINDNDIRKGTKEMDRLMEETNQQCDHTVFISQWLRDHFVERWFDPARPHSIIYNGADPRTFHPIGSAGIPRPGEPIRVVTHHWSDNPMKGFDVYEQFDAMIASGEAQGFAFTVIGRWPASLSWQTARTLPPMSGVKLAEELRRHHFYLTGSRWEPGGMHHVEGAQCGLPLLYHADGGGINEAGRRYGLEFRDNLAEQLQGMKEQLPEMRRRVLESPPSGERMCLEFSELIVRLAAARNRA